MHTIFKFIFCVLSLFSISLSHAAVNLPPSTIQTGSLSFEQLQQAAEAGDPDAQYAVGYMYYTGKNVSQNTQVGLNWIKRASVQGQDQAIEAMRLLAPSSAAVRAVPQKATLVSSTEENETSTSQEAVDVQGPKKTTSHKALAATDSDTSTATILGAPAHYFTIQLLLASNKAEIERYIRTNALGGKANYYPTKKSGYVLLYGVYKTRTEAQAGLLKLPVAVKAQKPWIKQISQVKESIKLR